MTARKIINEIANSREYKTLCKNITKGNELSEDLFQELIIILCEKDPKVIEDLYEKKHLKWFIVKILQNQYNSRTSDFYKTHVSFGQRSTEIIERKEITEPENEYYHHVVEFEKQKLVFNTSGEWYENKLFLAYLNEGSLRAAEAKTGISRTAIKNTIEPYISKLKAKAELKRLFMEQQFFRFQLPNNLKEEIFINSLYQELTPEEIIIQHLKIINKQLKISNRRVKETSQLRLF